MSQLCKYRRNPEDLEEVILRAKAKKLRDEKLSDGEISEKLNISRRKLLKLLGPGNFSIAHYDEKTKKRAQSLFKYSILSIIEISEKLGMAVETIRAWCKGLKRSTIISAKAKMLRNALKLKNDGLSYRQISKKLSIDWHTLTKMLNYHPKKRNLENKRLLAKKLCKTTLLTYEQIAKKFKVTPTTILNWCKGLTRPTKKIDKDRNLVRRLCTTTSLTLDKIGKKTGHNIGTVHKWCKGLNRPLKKRRQAAKKLAIKLWTQTSLNSRQIAKKTRMDLSTIRYWCRGLKRPKGVQYPRLTATQQQEIINLCKSRRDLTYQMIADLYEVNFPTIARICHGMRHIRRSISKN